MEAPVSLFSITTLSHEHVCASLMRSFDVVEVDGRKIVTGLPPSLFFGEANALAAHDTTLFAIIAFLSSTRLRPPLDRGVSPLTLSREDTSSPPHNCWYIQISLHRTQYNYYGKVAKKSKSIQRLTNNLLPPFVCLAYCTTNKIVHIIII